MLLWWFTYLTCYTASLTINVTIGAEIPQDIAIGVATSNVFPLDQIGIAFSIGFFIMLTQHCIYKRLVAILGADQT